MRPIDGDKLMMHLTDWWYSSFGQTETEESKAIKTVMDKIEQTLGEFALEKQDQDRWIPVTERLPKHGTTVLITNSKGNVSYGRFRGVEFWKDGGDGYWTWKKNTVEQVRAWRPLPEAYTEEEHDKP